MKRNIDDFDGMKDFIISIVTVVAWVLIGAIITIGYFTIDTKGESIIISFVSMIFTIVSSLGILATIGVYFWQRQDTEGNDNKKITAACTALSNAISLNNHFIKINKDNIEKLNKTTESITQNYIENDMLYAYPINKIDYIYIYKMTKINLNETLMEVAHIDTALYNAIFYYLTRIDIVNIGIQISIKSNRDIFTKNDCIDGHLESISKAHEKIISDMKDYKIELINAE
ncbi:hypothetical protein N0G65_003607 [Providencia rettgeri]|nr:hypothetical protein [Providencia rettgeri]